MEADKQALNRVSWFQGWGVLLGIPAFFCVAYLYPVIPYLPKVPICTVRHFLGVPCPGCGLTRSFVALVHGDLRGSIDAHPLGLVVVLWLAYFFGRAVWTIVRGRAPRTLLKQRQRDLLLYCFLAALILQWVVKLFLLYV